MGQVSGQAWAGGDVSMVVELVQIDDGCVRKKERSVGLWRKKEEMER